MTSSSESSSSLLESASPLALSFFKGSEVAVPLAVSFLGYTSSSLISSSLSETSSISTPFSAKISFYLWGKYPSLVFSTKGERCGGGAWPGL